MNRAFKIILSVLALASSTLLVAATPAHAAGCTTRTWYERSGNNVRGAVQGYGRCSGGSYAEVNVYRNGEHIARSYRNGYGGFTLYSRWVVAGPNARVQITGTFLSGY